MRCVHIPKTIDNDLVLNDHTPGYPSAARFVAWLSWGLTSTTVLCPVFTSPSYGATRRLPHRCLFIGACLSGRRTAPDLPPERPFDPASSGDVDRVYKKLGRCVVAVCEGSRTRVAHHRHQADPIPRKRCAWEIQLSGTGALGDLLADEVKKKLKISRVRADTYGYLSDATRALSPMWTRMKLARWERGRPNMPSGMTRMGP